ncbi:RidA family protein [Enterococcus sp. HY326]|uniref:RidA family protein n=1 Tax=Enterococcus sp. HY326 TaxID=2971265 RepID=UPI0022409F82|nr:RidA family protein [Enterococcus sp. HY326]
MAIYANSILTNGPLLIISGQTPQKDELIPDSIEEQLTIVIEKIAAIIAENQASLEKIVKMNVYLTDASYLPALREKLSAFYGEHQPAMTLVIVAGLIHPKFKVEIDAMVAVETSD